ncbi:MAG: GntG family PLP-dependent aldolase [Planctomycetota bacterium]|nr:GntG family PLP-dependent aldolase [Planctomycetota bacterium]
MDPVDLRSDTVTHPTEEMYRQMAIAPLGDDVFGDDPTVNRLEQVSAARLGKEAAMFVPTGTMANTTAVGTLTRPGDEMILMNDSHIYLYEAGGSARLWGVHPRPLPSVEGCLDANQIRTVIRHDDPHEPRTSLICLENTHNMRGGRAITAEQIAPAVDVAREHGLKMHLDGARIFHAEVKLGISAAEIAAPFDTVSFCLSKGLSCPIGSLLCGSAENIAEARRLRKLLGGGMRQVGVIASAGLVALDEGIDRLAEDHHRCQQLADGLRDIPGVHLEPDPPESNILFVRFDDLDVAGHTDMQDELEKLGVRALAVGDRGIRVVFHRQIDDEGLQRALNAFLQLRGS